MTPCVCVYLYISKVRILIPLLINTNMQTDPSMQTARRSPKKHLSVDQKLEAVHLYSSTKITMKDLSEKFNIHLSTAYDIIRSHRVAKLLVSSRLTSVVDEVIADYQNDISCATPPGVPWPMGVVLPPSSSLKKQTFLATSTCRGVYEIFNDTSSYVTSTSVPAKLVSDHFVFDAASVQTKVTSFKRYRNPRQFATPEDEEVFKKRKRSYQQWYRDTQIAHARAQNERLDILEMIVSKME
jgi:hypothetical protein